MYNKSQTCYTHHNFTQHTKVKQNKNTQISRLISSGIKKLSGGRLHLFVWLTHCTRATSASLWMTDLHRYTHHTSQRSNQLYAVH